MTGHSAVRPDLLVQQVLLLRDLLKHRLRALANLMRLDALGHLEQLERQLRSSMPQHVMDMLGQQAAYMGH